MVDFALEQELRDALAALALEQQRQVLEYARSLGAAARHFPGTRMMIR